LRCLTLGSLFPPPKIAMTQLYRPPPLYNGHPWRAAPHKLSTCCPGRAACCEVADAGELMSYLSDESRERIVRAPNETGRQSSILETSTLDTATRHAPVNTLIMLDICSATRPSAELSLLCQQYNIMYPRNKKSVVVLAEAQLSLTNHR